MIIKYLISLALILCEWSLYAQASGYVLPPGQGELLGPNRIIKASPKSGSLNAVVVLDSLRPGFSSTWHIHQKADEFFYVVQGEGSAEIENAKYPIANGAVIFVPRGAAHNLSVSDRGPMKLLFFFDQPGADEWFREAHEKFFSKSIHMSTAECNEMGKKYGYVCLDRN